MSSLLANAIHPIFGNPVFLGGFTFFMGGFFTMSYTSSQNDRITLERLKEADNGKSDKMDGHRQFMKRDSIAQFMELDPSRHGSYKPEKEPKTEIAAETPKGGWFQRCVGTSNLSL